jgi:capsular polysaccharide export protein
MTCASACPAPGDGVLVWGRSPTAWRGEALAARRSVALVRVEDAFLRSLHPGRTGEPPLGLLVDPVGVHFDSSGPSRMEEILPRTICRIRTFWMLQTLQ